MDGMSTAFDHDQLTPQPGPLVQPARPREKSKRPQLSCNPCRARKVKVSRIQASNLTYHVRSSYVDDSVIASNPVRRALYIRSPSYVNLISLRLSGSPYFKQRH